MINNFDKMPYLVKALFILCALFPIIVPVSVISGSILPVDYRPLAYGAASDLKELLMVSVLSWITLVPAYHFLTRRKMVFYSFPFAYLLGCCASPLVLSFLWSDKVYLYSIVGSSLFNGFLISLYLWFSKDVRRYLLEKGADGR